MTQLISYTWGRYIGLILLLSVSGCKILSPTQARPIYVTGLSFQNIGDYDAQNVKLRAVATNGQVACNKIEVNSSCGTGFPIKEYQAGQLELSWQMAERSYIELFVIPLPDDAEKNQRYTAVILLTDNGQYYVRLTRNNVI